MPATIRPMQASLSAAADLPNRIMPRTAVPTVPDACPNCVRRAYRQRLQRHAEQPEADPPSRRW